MDDPSPQHHPPHGHAVSGLWVHISEMVYARNADIMNGIGAVVSAVDFLKRIEDGKNGLSRQLFDGHEGDGQFQGGF